MPSPICVPCRREMSIKTNGYLVHLTQNGGRLYQIWSGDLWVCRVCGYETVLFADNQSAAAVHYRPETFERALQLVALEVSS